MEGASIKNRIGGISLQSVMELLSFAVILLFSAHDSLVRLIPHVPFSEIGIALLVVLTLLSLCSLRTINIRAVAIFVAFYLFIVIQYMFATGDREEYIFKLLINPYNATSLWAYFIVFSFTQDAKKKEKMLVVLAYLNTSLIIITVLLGRYSAEDKELNYMGLGITCATWIPFLIQNVFSKGVKWRLVHIAYLCGVGVFAAIYGNRGSLVALAAYLLYFLIAKTRMKRKILIIAVVGIVLIVFVYFQNQVIEGFLLIVDRVGIYSRNLNLLLKGNLTYSTHRTDTIWMNVFNAIKEQPWTGYGLCYDRVLNGGSGLYAHNLVLEAWLSFGVIAGTVLLLLHAIMGVKGCLIKEGSWANIIAPYFITSTVLLMFNNSFCQLAFFWAPLGMYLAYLSFGRKKAEKEVES